MSLYHLKVKGDIKEVREFINDPATKKQLQHREKLLKIRTNVKEYNTKIVNAHDAFYSQPVIDGDKYETIQLVLKKTAEDLDLEKALISTPTYSKGVLNFNVTADGKDEMVQKLPSMFIDNLLSDDYNDNNGYYANASYTGYTLKIPSQKAIEEGENENGTVTFTAQVALEGRESAYKPEAKDKEKAE